MQLTQFERKNFSITSSGPLCCLSVVPGGGHDFGTDTFVPKESQRSQVWHHKKGKWFSLLSMKTWINKQQINILVWNNTTEAKRLTFCTSVSSHAGIFSSFMYTIDLSSKQSELTSSLDPWQVVMQSFSSWQIKVVRHFRQRTCSDIFSSATKSYCQFHENSEMKSRQFKIWPGTWLLFMLINAFKLFTELVVQIGG